MRLPSPAISWRSTTRTSSEGGYRGSLVVGPAGTATLRAAFFARSFCCTIVGWRPFTPTGAAVGARYVLFICHCWRYTEVVVVAALLAPAALPPPAAAAAMPRPPPGRLSRVASNAARRLGVPGASLPSYGGAIIPPAAEGGRAFAFFVAAPPRRRRLPGKGMCAALVLHRCRWQQKGTSGAAAAGVQNAFTPVTVSMMMTKSNPS